MPDSATTPPSREQAARRAFSRVDLLTVIAVLMVMALLLTSVLARTRVSDYAFQCKNNLRQLILGWQMYAEDNKGKLPNCFDWMPGYPGYLSYGANNPVNTNLTYLRNSLLGPYVQDLAVFKCPADRSLGLEGTNYLPRVRNFSISQSFSFPGEGHLEDHKPNYYRHYVNSADMVLPPPARLWVMVDESPDSVNDAAFGVGMEPYGGTWMDIPSILHDGGCGFAFGDGHAEIKRWIDSRTLALKVTYTTAAAHGVAQLNNPDIMWLQDGATAPK